MTNLDRILITIWILIISVTLVILYGSRPTEVTYQSNVWHVQKAYMDVYSDRWIMSAETEFQVERSEK